MTWPSAHIPSSGVDQIKDFLDFSWNNWILLLDSEFLKDHSDFFILLINTVTLPNKSRVPS